MTGLSGFYGQTPIKMLELLAQLVPHGALVGALIEVETPFYRGYYRRKLENAAKKLDLHTDFAAVRHVDDVPLAVARLRAKKPAALFVLLGPIFFLGAKLVRQAETLNIPVIYPFESIVEAGGLMAYSVSLTESYHRAAYYVDRILRGAKPGDLPIEQPVQLSLAVNLRTAKKQGIHLPQEILLIADQVIK